MAMEDVLVEGCDEFTSAAENTTGGLGPTGWCREVVRRAGHRGSEREEAGENCGRKVET